MIFISILHHSDAYTIMRGTFSYIFYPLISRINTFKDTFSFPISNDNFLVSIVSSAYSLSLYMAYQNIGVPYEVLMLNPST